MCGELGYTPVVEDGGDALDVIWLDTELNKLRENCVDLGRWAKICLTKKCAVDPLNRLGNFDWTRSLSRRLLRLKRELSS